MMWPFKKKEPSLDSFGDIGSQPTGLETRKPVDETYNKLNEPLPHETEFQPKPISQQIQSFSQNTDLQLISAKLDTVKAMLDVINQRITSLEKDVEEKKKQKLW